MSNGTIRKALVGMGYQGEMTGHGFSGVASTILHECGHMHEYIEAQLAHGRKTKSVVRTITRSISSRELT
jgi:hypothetical protein